MCVEDKLEERELHRYAVTEVSNEARLSHKS